MITQTENIQLLDYWNRVKMGHAALQVKSHWSMNGKGKQKL